MLFKVSGLYLLLSSLFTVAELVQSGIDQAVEATTSAALRRAAKHSTEQVAQAATRAAAGGTASQYAAQQVSQAAAGLAGP